MVKVDLSGAQAFFTAGGPDYAAAAEAHRVLATRSGAGSDFTGWLELPQRIKDGELKRIVAAGQAIRKQAQVLLVIGIGGSYLGARAAIELLRNPSHNQTPGETEVYFLGTTLSPDAINEICALVEGKDFAVNVVSKSGGTLEPALSFRVAKALLEEKYGKAGANKRIYATTDEHKGKLHDYAAAEGWEMFVVPDDVGGRFSVLSAVGLLPMAAAGIDVEKVIDCAIEELRNLDLRSPENPAWQYAAARQNLYRSGKPSRSSLATSPRSASWRSGGSSFTARARARTVSASIPPAWNSTPTCTPWVSSFRTAPAP